MEEFKEIDFGEDDTLKSILKDHEKDSFFSHPITIQVFLNQDNKELYKYRDHLITKIDWEFGDDYRILFEEDRNILGELKKEDPVHIGSAYLPSSKKPSKKDGEKIFYNMEASFDLNSLVKLQGSAFKNLRNSYNSFKRRNKNITLENGFNILKNDLSEVEAMLKRWERERRKEGNKKASIDHDLSILKKLENYKSYSSKLKSKDKLIGLEISVPSLKEKTNCLNLIRKNLPSERYSGEYLQVEHAKRLVNEGFKFANDSSAVTKSQWKYKEKFTSPETPPKKFYFHTILNKDKKKMGKRRIINFSVLRD